MKYKAFICYKHSEFSRPQAIALETALKRYAKPLFKPPIKIFRDEKHMAPDLDLPSLVRKALNESEHLIFLAEKGAAESPWCQQELEYWCGELKKKDDLIIVYLNDKLVYNANEKKILWDQTDALPDLLQQYISSIPLYIDLSWAKTPESRDLLNPKYKHEINAVMAKLRGVDPAELNDEEIRVFRRNRRLRTWAIILLTTLLILSIITSFWAMNRTNYARQQEEIARDSAEVAQNQRQIARDSAFAAQQQRQVARLQKDTAVQERQNAEAAQADAEQQRDIARQERENAVAAQKEAVLQRDSAQLAREEAVRQRDTAKLERQRAEQALYQAQSNFLEAQALLNLYKNDPTRAMKISEYLYKRDPVQISIPMINCFYDDFIFYDGKTYAAPFYEILNYGKAEKVRTAEYLPNRLLVRSMENSHDILLSDLAGNDPRRLSGHQGAVNSFAYSPDGSHFLSISDDNTVIIWSKEGKKIARLSDPGAAVFTGASFIKLRGGETAILTSGKGGRLKVWSMDGRELLTDPLNISNIFRLGVTPDGRFAATSQRNQSIIIRKLDKDRSTFTPYDTLDLSRELRSMRFFSTSDSLLVATSKTAFIYHLKSKKIRNILNIKWRQLIHAVTLSSDENYALIAFSDGTVGIYELAANKSVTTLKGSNYPVEAAWMNEQDGQVYTLSLNGTLRKWNLKGKLIELKRNPGAAFTAQLYTAEDSKNAVWNLTKKGNLVVLKNRRNPEKTVELIGHLEQVTDVNFAPADSLIISCSVDKTARIWDLNGVNLHTFYTSTPLRSAFFTRDNKWIVLQPAPGSYLVYPVSPPALIEIARGLNIPGLKPEDKEYLGLK